MAHFIDNNCIGCTACVTVCPTEAISGERKALHYIDPKLCIDCDACVRSCPVLSIADEFGVYKPRIPKRVDWPKPVIDPVSCTGCDFCVEICPFDCLELAGEGQFFGTAVLTKPNACVSCKECEEVCAKGAIIVVPTNELHPISVAEGRA
ncbi:MAG: ferredoxin [Firmicutes bacterium]|nr:ferredoxin [Bacillota bacterium]